MYAYVGVCVYGVHNFMFRLLAMCICMHVCMVMFMCMCMFIGSWLCVLL